MSKLYSSSAIKYNSIIQCVKSYESHGGEDQPRGFTEKGLGLAGTSALEVFASWGILGSAQFQHQVIASSHCQSLS